MTVDLLEAEREADARDTLIARLRSMGYDASLYFLQEATRERIRECERLLEQTRRLLGDKETNA